MGTGFPFLPVLRMWMIRTHRRREHTEHNVAMVTSIFSVNHSNHTLLCLLFISAYNIAKSDEGTKVVCLAISHLLLFPSLPRHHYGSNDDNPEYNSQEVVTQGFLRDCHGPLCFCVFHFRVRSLDGIRHLALFHQQQKSKDG